MERRGHEVVWPADKEGEARLRQLATCDVVHVYRRSDEPTRKIVTELVKNRVPITWDNDDDFTTAPKESPGYKNTGGLAGQRFFAKQVRVAKMAGCVTTPSELLAEKYRRNGVAHVEVIGNYLDPDLLRSSRRHDGLVIGWVAGLEHRADAARIDIAGALRRVLQVHAEVRVECIGVDLALPERYEHDLHVPFRDLPRRLGGWDIGIAPLADIPFNSTRSDIKLKEYASVELPWLASPIGPYLGLGEAQGGCLVRDDQWFEATSHLVSHRRERRRLARRAKAWAKRQTIDAVADRWEQVFEAAHRAAPR
jgi:hypothetical protein